MSVAFSPDGMKILTGSADKTARLWETATGNLLATLSRQIVGIKSVAFSPGGNFAIICDEHGRVLLWQTSGEQVADLIGIYMAIYRIEMIYWQDTTFVALVDMGGPEGRPHFYRLQFEG